MRTCVHAHMRTCAQAHTRTRARAHARTRARAHARTRARAHARTRARAHARQLNIYYIELMTIYNKIKYHNVEIRTSIPTCLDRNVLLKLLVTREVDQYNCYFYHTTISDACLPLCRFSYLNGFNCTKRLSWLV